MPEKGNTIKILGIDFYNGSVTGVIDRLQSGGLLVVPSAPGLVTIPDDSDYYESLLGADIVIPDSGYMSLLWNLFHKEKINRISGLEFLIAFLNTKQTNNLLLVDPSQNEAESNINYLNSVGFQITPSASYLAPFYNKKGAIADQTLLDLIDRAKPKYVIINLGGGIQEKLGAYLRKNLSYKPGIICTGAAIAFLTGNQANIPAWADKLSLGWLIRCIENPNLYIPRYAKSFKLIVLMLRFGKNSPI